MAYTIEEEQELNELKAWWKENYKTVILALVLGIGGVAGWNFWKSHQVTKTYALSAQYEQLIYNAPEQAKIDAFLKEGEKTTYSVLFLLDQARKSVEQKDFVKAEVELKQALTQSSDEILSSVTALRLAAVQFQQNQFDVALQTLTQVKSSTWQSKKALLEGDIQFAKGDKAAAKVSYEQAQKNASPLEQQWIQVRLNNL